MKQIDMFSEIVVDNFAGGGGASTGIEMAIGRSVDIAINHDPEAIAMHRANHPNTEHYCENVWDVDPVAAVRGRPVGLLWLSPDCKHHSKAKGGKPIEKNIRGLAWVATKWTGKVPVRCVILENVPEFQDWGPLIAKRDKKTGRVLKKSKHKDPNTGKMVHDVAEKGEYVPLKDQLLIPDPKKKGRNFKAFVRELRKQGYAVEWRQMRACDYGAATSRNRLFLQARNDGRPIVWPEPTHADPKSKEVKEGKLLPWKPAADIIDWDLPVKSIFGRKKPLAENTMKRIAKGLEKFVFNNPQPYIHPFMLQVNNSGAKHHYCKSLDEPLGTITSHNGFALAVPYISRIGQTGFAGDNVAYNIEQPLTTVTSKAEHLLVMPTLVQVGCDEKEEQSTEETDHNIPVDALNVDDNKFALAATYISRQFGQSIGNSMDVPLGTITSGGGGKSQLVAAFVTKYYGGNYKGAGADLEGPLPTVTAKDHNALITSHLIKLRNNNIGQPVTEPLHTITSGGQHFGEVRAFLIKYYGTDIGQDLGEPLHTITSKARFGLVTIHGELYQIVDIAMRMLEPHELFAAHAFPQNYIIDKDDKGKPYPKHAQVNRVGNSVVPVIPTALVRASLPELCDIENTGNYYQAV